MGFKKLILQLNNFLIIKISVFAIPIIVKKPKITQYIMFTILITSVHNMLRFSFLSFSLRVLNQLIPISGTSVSLLNSLGSLMSAKSKEIHHKAAKDIIK